MRRGVEAAQNQALKKASAVERLEALENNVGRLTEAFEALVKAINENFAADRKVRESVVKTVNAITSILGEDKVSLRLQERDVADLEQRASDAEVGLESLVQEGRVVESLTFGDQTVIVKCRQLKDGVVMPPRHLILPPTSLTEEVQKLLPGTSAGDILTLSDGSTVEIIALYEAVEVPAAAESEVVHPDAIVSPGATTDTDFVEIKAPIEVSEVKAE
jgi:hypothetical protein